MDKVRYVNVDAADMQAVNAAFEKVEAKSVSCCNWSADYPYAPDVKVRMFHNGGCLFLKYDVCERYTAAWASEDMGNVWEDSCCEFFISPDGNGYYNFETSCIGKLLLTHRLGRSEAVCPAPKPVLDSVIRIPSLGTECFDERTGDNVWSLVVGIPCSALFKHRIQSWSGLDVRMNVYKCGDRLTEPHFLSWKPIGLPSPDFHCPAFFAEVSFE